MTGSGGGGGYVYQGKVTAFVAVHILTQQKLNWIDEADDVPTATAIETGGAGDDLDITLQNGTIIELQAKHGLGKNKLWDAIIKLTEGLRANSSRYGILLIDSTSSGTIRNDLRTDLIRLGQGRTDRLKQITKEFLQKLPQGIINEAEIFRRLSIRVLDLDDGQPNSESACKILSQILEEKNEGSSAWKLLWGEGVDLITKRGRHDSAGWARILSKESIQLAATAQNPIVIIEKYRNWLESITAHFTIPGIDDKFSMANDWISLRVKEYKNEDQNPFKAAFIPELFRLSIITGESGSGKSTLTKYLAHYLTGAGRTVLLVRLSSVGKLLDKHPLFEDAFMAVAAGESSLRPEQLKFALCHPDYLLVDGLDECRGEQANLASKLCAWSEGHPKTKIIVTSRPGYEREYFPDWKCLELLPLEESDIKNFSERILKTISDRDKFMNWIKTSEVISVAAKTPLLLGFLIQIFQEPREPIRNRAKIYKKIIDIAHEKPLLDRESPDLSETKETIIYILAVVGWELISSFVISEKDLRQAVAKRLAKVLSIELLKAKNSVENVLNFWIQRRILDRIKIEGDDFIRFTHKSINEYTAGFFINEMSDSDFREWYLTSRKSFISKESITFATELGSAERIIDILLSLNNDNLVDENDILLSSEILKKINDPSSSLVEKVFKHLEPVLESRIQSNVFRAASNLISFYGTFTQLTSQTSITHLNHHQSWTRLAAFQIALAIDSDNIDVNQLEKQTDQIINEIEENEKEYLKPVELSKIFVSAFFRRKSDDFKKQFLINSFEYLLKNNLNVKNIQRFKSVITKESLSDVFKYSLVKLVWELIINPSDVGLLHLDPKYLNLFNVIIEWETLRREKIIKMTESHEKMKFEKHNEVIGKVFLESIIRVVEEESIVSEAPHEFLLLGILIQGMCLWTATMLEWREIDQCPNVNAVDVVVKGAIIAMQINEQALGAEARTLLMKIEEKTDNIFTHIPEVPAEPQWQLVKNVDISVDQLKEALDHSSSIIKRNALEILVQKIGENETINFLKSKGLIK
jgi:energy-coupling factor transporter ATP-binding protein EcfA2